MILKAQLGNITKIPVDAIVNSAQPSLRRGGGVDGAIHEAAGPELQEECFTIEPPKCRVPEVGERGEVTRCSTGGVQVTKAYRLPAKWVFHTVGPIWRDRHLLGDEDLSLSLCYRHCLEKAVELQVKRISFPSISTGIYCFPLERAARIAVLTTMDFPGPKDLEVIFVCFDRETYDLYKALT